MAMVVGAALVLLAIWLVMIFNGLVKMRNQVKNALVQIDVQLKRRHDLIPNLVATTKGYLQHETQTLQAVIAARNHASQLHGGAHQEQRGDYLALLAQAETQLSRALGRLYAVVENYPELKADKLVKELFDELTNTENRIGFARQHYNDSVMFYNNAREMFPNNLVSAVFAFEPIASLQFADKSIINTAPVVSLS